MEPKPRFVADDHLAKLARLLRTLGFDTLWKNPITDEELLRLAEGRTLLTRHRKLILDKRPADFVLISADHDLDQLAQLVREKQLTIDPGAFFTRCTICNHPLEPVEKSEVLPLLPDHVRQTIDLFCRCGSCHKIYWEGSHTERLRKKFRQIGLLA